MKLIRMLFLAATLILVAANAQAVDPACVGAVQPDPVDLSAGTATFCLSQTLADGTAVDSTKTLDCTLDLFDDGGVSLGTQAFSGGPGTAHAVTVPRDGIGSAVASCILDGLASANGTPVVVFPVEFAPTPPVLLP